VDWDRERYEKIVEDLRPFLLQSGFLASKTKFVPVSAIAGVNLVNRTSNSTTLSTWYNGPTLVDLLGRSELELLFRIELTFRLSYHTLPRQVGSTCALA
jgi:elongation factor 1 alpha-like protein